VNIYTKYEKSANTRMSVTEHLTDDQKKQIGDKCAIMQQYYLEL